MKKKFKTDNDDDDDVQRQEIQGLTQHLSSEKQKTNGS